jgi:hypothetical protein
VNGDVAAVPVHFPARTGNDSGTVTLRLERREENWRVIGIEPITGGLLAVFRRETAKQGLR